MNWKVLRKEKALRNSLHRVKNSGDRVSYLLLAKRMAEANVYLNNLKLKQKREWGKSF